MAATPTYALRYRVLGDTPDIAAGTQNLAEDTEAKFITVDAAIATLHNPPRAQLRQTTLQALTAGVFASIQFQAEDRDSHGGHDNATNNTRYTIQRNGDYWVAGGVAFASGAGFRALQWLKNGVTIIGGSGVSDTATAGAVWRMAARTMLIPGLVVGDYLELQAFSDVGLNTSVAAGVESTMTVLYAAA